MITIMYYSGVDLEVCVCGLGCVCVGWGVCVCE